MVDSKKEAVGQATHTGKRSRVLTCLGLAYAAAGAVNLARALQSHTNLSLLAEWDPTLSPGLLLALSLIWAALFMGAAWGIWHRQSWGRRLGLWLPPLYGLYKAGSTLLFTPPSYSRGRWGLEALSWAAVSLLAWWLLTQSRTKQEWRLREGEK